MDKMIKDNKDGEYTVTYTLYSAEEHTVEVALNGQPLTGSPWCVQVPPHQYNSAYQFGTRRIGWNANIAFSEMNETVAVADFKKNRVHLFSSSGKHIKEFVSDDGRPISVAFTKSGELLVVYAGRISLFSEGLQFIKRITNDQVTNYVWHLSVTHDGRIIVTCLNNEIKVLPPDATKVLHSFTASNFYFSPLFAVYHQDRFFVSYRSVHFIKVFNEEGVFLYDIGSEGTGDGQLQRPLGLAIDKYNNLVVCASGNKRLQVFTLDGKFVSSVDQKEPHSIVASNSGYLFVANNFTGTHVDVLY